MTLNKQAAVCFQEPAATKLVIQIPSLQARTIIGENYLYGPQRNPYYFSQNINELKYSSHVTDFVSICFTYKMAEANFTIFTAILDLNHFFAISL